MRPIAEGAASPTIGTSLIAALRKRRFQPQPANGDIPQEQEHRERQQQVVEGVARKPRAPWPLDQLAGGGVEHAARVLRQVCQQSQVGGGAVMLLLWFLVNCRHGNEFRVLEYFLVRTALDYRQREATTGEVAEGGAEQSWLSGCKAHFANVVRADMQAG